MKRTPDHEPRTTNPIHQRSLLQVGDVLTAMRGRLARTGHVPAVEHERRPSLTAAPAFEHLAEFHQDQIRLVQDGPSASHPDA